MTPPPPSPPPSPSSSSPLLTETERRDKLTECLLSQYKFCAGGVVAGGAFSMARASTVRVGPWPLLAGGFLGTMGDFIYGYFVECAHLRDDNDSIIGVKEKK
eukprot:g2233.t1 g2233   contig11:990427-990824(-)